jgi:hypothetical protein
MATTNYSWNLPTVGGSENTWGTSLNANWTALDTLLGGTNATEFAILDGATVTTAELNILDGVTATTAELNILDGVTATTAEINLLDGVTWSLSSYNTLTATAAELNVLDGISGIASQAEAEAGTSSTTLMTPQRTNQAIQELAPSPILARCAFDGTSSGTISVEANGVNVANVTKNGTGDYTINFTSSLANANYAVVGMSATRNSDSNDVIALHSDAARTTSSVRIINENRAGGNSDSSLITITVIG